MGELDQKAAEVWNQKSIPVIYRQGGGQPVLVWLPPVPADCAWLRGDHRREPEWGAQFGCWEIPQSWLDDVVTRSLQRFGRIYLVQPYRVEARCVPACWNAKGDVCECSCMGANHGTQHPLRKQRVILGTFAVQWHERRLACRLMEQAQAQ